MSDIKGQGKKVSDFLENNNYKTLILYFSESGHTESFANVIQEIIGGDLKKLETVEEYPKGYRDLLDIAKKEKDQNERPPITTKINNIDEYDVVFIGYPLWWYDLPMAFYTFFDENDLSGKVIIPFCTHGGSGLLDTPQQIQDYITDAAVMNALAIREGSAKSSKDQIKAWLENLGF